jgi:GntR family transcriptional regulator, transcriptional repressor for pyruvate dehydrogenase complex
VHIRRPGSDHLTTRLRDLLSLSSVAARDVTEVRTLLEVGIVPLLCGQADDQDIAALLDICDRQERVLVEQGQYDTSLSTAFHARLAAATHNTAFEVLIRSFRGSLRTAFGTNAPPTPEAGRLVLSEHRAILAAIQARDPATGTGAMRDHLASVRLRLLGTAG